MENGRNLSHAAPESVRISLFDDTVMQLPPATLIEARRAVVV
ncbi:hypothetical protein PAMC26577_04210 [Caballeronia sordidicola]|uniref:Uncharacterized protein n=1 Tax=Caballeronia sordidicola TaxID=196367 RepID=A0A242N565_CABSO|nr:hypothetical protein PAMC26577_04210 [Caballeronia sordidicola]